MRDSARIERIMHLVTTIWMQQSDMRFHQLIDSLQYRYVQEHPEQKHLLKMYYEKDGHFESRIAKPDLFYVEDEDFEDFLRKFAK